MREARVEVDMVPKSHPHISRVPLPQAFVRATPRSFSIPIDVAVDPVYPRLSQGASRHSPVPSSGPSAVLANGTVQPRMRMRRHHRASGR